MQQSLLFNIFLHLFSLICSVVVKDLKSEDEDLKTENLDFEDEDKDWKSRSSYWSCITISEILIMFHQQVSQLQECCINVKIKCHSL